MAQPWAAAQDSCRISSKSGPSISRDCWSWVSSIDTTWTTEDIEPEALSPRDAAFMKELYELMEKELANVDLDITRITEMMKISRTKFYYKVKGLTGENPSVFFKRYKLNRAADLLKEGKYNMSEIAYMTGFNTLSHFSTSFKKQFGVPPSEYGGSK